MTIALANGSHGGIFDRAGWFGGMLNDINAARGGAATSNVLAAALMTTRVATAEDYWKATVDNRAVIDTVYSALGNYQSSQGSFLSQLQSFLQATMIKMADQDVTLPPGKTLTQALAVLISQMKTAGASINASTVAAGAMTAVGSPVGTPIICTSVIDNAGLTLQYPFPETITYTCTQGNQDGATANQEPMSVIGQGAVSDTLSHLWPGGSGTSSSLTCVDASTSNGAGNALQNSDFETFTNTNIADNWVVVTGARGTDILAGGTAYTGANCMEFAGDGATLSQIKQQFNTTPSTTLGSGGTSFQLKPLTVYAVNFWVKMSATPTNGTFIVDLHDGSAVINDANGAANSVSKVLSTVSTSWVNVNGYFRTPANLPANQYIRCRLSVAIDNAKNLFFDRLALAPAAQLYAGGPYVAVFSGATKLVKNDSWTVAITNTYGGFAKLLERMFGLRSLGLVIPYSGSPTIADSLIG